MTTRTDPWTECCPSVPGNQGSSPLGERTVWVAAQDGVGAGESVGLGPLRRGGRRRGCRHCTVTLVVCVGWYGAAYFRCEDVQPVRWYKTERRAWQRGLERPPQWTGGDGLGWEAGPSAGGAQSAQPQEGAGQAGAAGRGLAEGLHAACSGGGGGGGQRAGEHPRGAEARPWSSWGPAPHCACPAPGLRLGGRLLRPCWWLWGTPGQPAAGGGSRGPGQGVVGLLVRGQLRASWRRAVGGF